MRFVHRFSALLALLLVASLAALAQQSGVVQGTVTDETGAVIPGAAVTAVDAAGQAKTVTTDQNGAYAFPGLKPGRYTVRVNTTGFAKFERAVDLAAGRTLQVDAPLKVQMANQQVEVQGDSTTTVSVDPSSNAGAIVLRGEDLAALSDDPDDLASDLQALAGPAAGPNGGQIFVDGFSGARLPPKESIREIRINSNPFAAEYDRLGFGRIEILTKPGTDKFHGGAMFGISDALFNSRNPFLTTKPDFMSKQYGANLGGPINKRSSFFFDLEKRDIDDNAIINATILDPNTFLPESFRQAVITPNRRTSLGPRIDYQLSQNNTLVARYNFTKMDRENAGISEFTLPSQAYNTNLTEHTVQITETAILGAKVVNETRLQYMHALNEQIGDNSQPTINVSGAFQGGGANVGQSSSLDNRWEITNTTSIAQGKHAIKFGGRVRAASLQDISARGFGGTFLFGGGLAPVLDANNQPVLDASGNPVLNTITSLERYRRTLALQQAGLSIAQIRLLGGGATQFSVTGGNPLADVNQTDVGVFVQDDWRARPNLTLSMGLRYETQTNIHDKADLGPRFGFAWAPHSTGAKPGKTVIRGGIGMFYDRFDDNLYLQTLRFNGVTESRYIVNNPLFFPTIPPLSQLADSKVGQTITRVDPNLRAPYIIQSAIGVERQLPKNTTLAVTFTNSRGVHMLRSRNLTAPPPGTIVSENTVRGSVPASDVIYQYESTGIMNQHQLITNLNTRMSRSITLFTFYVFNHVKSDTDGAGSFPSNPYDLRADYGRAAYDIRHRFVLGGNITAPWNIRFAPFIMANSGSPYNLIIGRDLNGDLQYNDRPAFAADPNAPGVVMTPFGALDPNPKPGEQIVPRNYGEGPASFTVNLRLSRTFGFGEPRGTAAPNTGGDMGGGDRGSRGGGGGRMGGGGGPRGGAGFGGGGFRGGGGPFGESTNHRYNLTLSVSARNLLNTVNLAPPVGDISSPLFGQSIALAGGGFGPGGGSSANNRRIDFMLRFTF